MLSREKNCQILHLNITSFNYLIIKMVSNDKTMNYKVVALDETYSLV
jgi:uncharacterized protein (DUF927 family)